MATKEKDDSEVGSKKVVVEHESGEGNITVDDLDYVIDILREEQKIIIDFISDKEKKKLQIFRFQLTAIAILGAASVAVFPLLENFVSKQDFSDIKNPDVGAQLIFIVYLVLNVVGLVMVVATNLMGSTVMRHIMSIKSDVMLAVRQINCNREAIQKAITAKLCGTYPKGEWAKKDHEKWPVSNEIYVRHNKFPTDNDNLRKIFLRRHRNWLIRLVYFILRPFGLYKYRRRCRNKACSNNQNGNRCYEIKLNGEWNHFSTNRFNETDIDKDVILPEGKLLKLLLLGYRSAYVQSADMMAVVATGSITILVSLLLSLGNFYLWYRLNIILGNTQPELAKDALVYAIIFCLIDVAIVLIFIKHFMGIADRSMNRIIGFLSNDS